MSRLQPIDDQIGRKLAEAERSGELKSAEWFGKPIQEDAGWTQTPEAHRMSMKILKDAGVVPHEVEMLNERARLRADLEAVIDPAKRESLGKKLSLLEQSISLRLEAMSRQS